MQVIHEVADFPLESNISDKSLHGLRVNARQVAGVRVAVRVPVDDIEIQNGVMALAGIVDNRGGRGSIWR